MYLLFSRLNTIFTRLWVKVSCYKSMLVFETKIANICWILDSFYNDWNFGIYFIWVSNVRISRDMSEFEKPKFMMLYRNGRKAIEELKLPVSLICLKSPKQTSYGKTGICSLSKTSEVLSTYLRRTAYFLLMLFPIRFNYYLRIVWWLIIFNYIIKGFQTNHQHNYPKIFLSKISY